MRSTTSWVLPVSTEPRRKSTIAPNCATRSASCHAKREVQRLGDPGGVAVRVGAMPFEHPDLVPEGVGGHEGNVPAVGVARHELQRDLLAVAAEPDREPGLLRLRLAARVAELEELAVEVDDVLGEERPDALHLLLELAEPDGRGRERDAVGVELALVPAGAEAEGDPAVGEVVDGGDRLREHRGVAVAGAVHEAAAAHVGRGHRQGGMGGEPLEALGPRFRIGDVGRVEVVPHRDPAEAETLDAAPEGLDLVGRRVLQTGVDPETHDR